MNDKQLLSAKTLGELKKAGYRSRPIKDELRENLIVRLRKKQPVFGGIFGYEDTVIPDLQRAILSRHNILLLGLRGQAKTRLARLMVDLLDEYVPIVDGSELNDDPFRPISRYARDLLAQRGDETPITWLHRSERYVEKLATPDVTVADLIGDVDPIRAATLKLPYSDERVLHFGLVPRSNRCIFVLNELPDLQARIQVALFNILEEGDVQIRGFKIRLPLDIQFVFTANPEDYTNRGSIVTPLKDRIESQILTHYPRSLEIARKITRQEARPAGEQRNRVKVPALAEDLIEQIAFEARRSEYVDPRSGVSARLSIAAYENLLSAAERRILLNGEKETTVRVADFWGVVPAITGKIELVYEGEQEGALRVAHFLIGKAIRSLFPEWFPNPETFRREPQRSPYAQIIAWFAQGNVLDLLNDIPNSEFSRQIGQVPGLREVVQQYHGDRPVWERLFLMEFLLHGLAEFSVLGKHLVENGATFSDLLSSMLSVENSGEEDEEEQPPFP
jgi:magnesium chelatase subunit I